MLQTSSDLKKIGNIIPYKINIANHIDYHNYFKKGSKKPLTLSFEYLDTNYYHNNELRTKMKEKVIHLLKSAKPIKSLQLHQCIIQYDQILDKEILQISKRMSRVKSLSLPDYALSQAVVRKYTLWMKYSNGLKDFNYLSPPSVNFPDGKTTKFDTTVKKFFQEIRRDRLNSLNITNHTTDDQTGISFLKFNQYPKTLKSLAFDWRHYSTNMENSLWEVENSLDHLKHLSSLKLAFRNQAYLLDPILSSIKELSQITHLSIEFLDNVHQESGFQFNKLAKLRKLQSVRLKFDFWPKNFETFLQILERCPLLEFRLEAAIGEVKHLLTMKRFLSSLRNLKSLDLKIYMDLSCDLKEATQELFITISQIDAIMDLRLHLFNAKAQDKLLDCELLQSLSGVFSNLEKLETFCFKFNLIEPRQAFLEVLSLISRISSALKRLEIDVGEYKPLDSDYQIVVDFLCSLKSIEILRLRSLSVDMNQLMLKFVNEIEKLRYLRIFELKQMNGDLSDPDLIKGVERILTKRGLNKFECWIDCEENNKTNREESQFKPIDLKELLKRNPDLQKYPEANGLFIYYDDDIEWKWNEEITDLS